MTAAEQLAALDQANLSTMEKGRRFEAFVQAYLQQSYYVLAFRWVQRWADWAAGQPGVSARDVGINLVAEDVDGQRWAIQCKHWQRRVDWDNLATFIGLARSPRFAFDALLVVAPHRLARQFQATAPNTKGVTDIPDLQVHGRPDSVSVQWDLVNKEGVAYPCSAHPDTRIVLATVAAA